MVVFPPFGCISAGDCFLFFFDFYADYLFRNIMSSNSDDDFEQPTPTIIFEGGATRVAAPTAPFVLRVGVTQEGTFDDVIQSTFALCNTLGKFYMVHKRDKKRLILLCATQTKWENGRCPFYVGARCDSLGTVRVHTLNGCHTCGVRSARLRNVKSAVLASASPTIDAFVTSSARRGGNAAQLREQCKVLDGFNLKAGQLHRIIADKKSGTGDHLAQYRYLESLFVHLNSSDPLGTYELKSEWVEYPTTKRLVSFFVAPSATKHNHKRFEPVAAVDCAHLTSITGFFFMYNRCVFFSPNRCVCHFYEVEPLCVMCFLVRIPHFFSDRTVV